MKKIIFSVSIVMACLTANAQEPEKKKDAQAPSRGQERAINDIGVSTKSETKKSSSNSKQSATTQPAKQAESPKESKETKEQKDAKKPE